MPTYGRQLSPFIQNIIDTAGQFGAKVYNTELAFDIVLRDTTRLQIATATMTVDSLSIDGASVNITPMTFEGRIEGSPDLRHSQANAPDVGSLDVINLDSLFTSIVPDPTRLYDNAEVKVYLCFRKSTGNYEGLQWFEGNVRNVGGEDVANFQLLSDMSNRAATLGQEITQRCLNELGDDFCGVGNLPVGAICSKVWNDPESGCLYWGGVFRGVPFINPDSIATGYTGTPQGNGGWIEPVWQCVEPHSFIKTPKGWRIGKLLKRGDAVVDHFGRHSEIEEIEVVHADFRFLVESNTGASLICSPHHPFLTSTDDAVGTPLLSLPFTQEELEGDGVYSTERKKQPTLLTEINGRVKMSSRFWVRPIAAGNVLKLTLRGNQIFLAGREPNKAFGSHNNKSHWQTISV